MRKDFRRLLVFLAILVAVAGIYGVYAGILVPGWEFDHVSAELGRAYERSRSRNEQAVKATPIAQTTDTWRDAVNEAMAASEAAQTAATVGEWLSVVTLWSNAIELMLAVPETSEYYTKAQQKAVEYQPNLEYVQQKWLEARIRADVKEYAVDGGHNCSRITEVSPVNLEAVKLPVFEVACSEGETFTWTQLADGDVKVTSPSF